MKSTILSLLRDKNTSLENFRKAADQLASLLSFKVHDLVEKGEHTIETPHSETKGFHLKQNIFLIPILRAGLALLYPFMKLFPSSPVGFVGLQRDEETALPIPYYEKLPSIEPSDAVVILDPMIATGGSGREVIKTLKSKGVIENNIIYAGIIAAPEGIKAIKEIAPKMQVVCIEIDTHLNDKKFIMPGLGDFGDRYFGT